MNGIIKMRNAFYNTHEVFDRESLPKRHCSSGVAVRTSLVVSMIIPDLGKEANMFSKKVSPAQDIVMQDLTEEQLLQVAGGCNSSSSSDDDDDEKKKYNHHKWHHKHHKHHGCKWCYSSNHCSSSSSKMYDWNDYKSSMPSHW